MAGEQADTIVGANVELKGSLHNRGPITVHGTVIGDITSDSLVVIGETAIITGPIAARQVDVHGQVHGSIAAEEQIELHPKSVVQGDLTTARPSIKPGAVFVGKSQMHVAEAALPSAEKKHPRVEIE